MLSEAFFKAITSKPVPIDFRVMCALRQSPFAIDLYTWLTWRIFRMNQKKDLKTNIRLWGKDSLAEQMGSEYSRANNFKAAIAEALEMIKLVWPNLQYHLTATHLTIIASPVPIAQTSTLKGSRALAEVKPDQLSVRTMAWFDTTYPKHNPRAAVKDFKAWIAQREIDVKDIDARFRNFCLKWVETHE